VDAGPIYVGFPRWMPVVAFGVILTCTWRSKLSASAYHDCSEDMMSGALRGARSLEVMGYEMKPNNLKLMSVDELWALHVEISAVLVRKMSAQKNQLDSRLRELLANGTSKENPPRGRRPYPRVFPKYRNPKEPSETWAGRGKQPRWLTSQLKSGKKLEDFRIQTSSDRKRRSGRR
jgi:DNA-binding protein H-NS